MLHLSSNTFWGLGMLVSAIGKFNTFNKACIKSQSSFGTVKKEPAMKCTKPMAKPDLKTNFKG